MQKKLLLTLCLVGGLWLAACASSKAMPTPEKVAPLVEMPAAGAERGFGGGNYEVGMPAPAPTAMPAKGMDVSAAPASEQRLVIKNADLSLVVSDPQQSMDAIAHMAEAMGGFVVSSNVYQRQLADGSQVPQANIRVRVPVEKFQEALDQIKAGAGRVENEVITGQDVTQEYTDLQSRLRNLEAAEQQLQEIMDQAYKIDDVLQVYNQLVQVREQIEVIKGQMKYYEQSAAFSLINVELIPDRAVQPIQIGGWEPVGVAKDAIQALIHAYQRLTTRLIWLVLYVLPASLPYLLVLWLVYRWGKRVWQRRRQSASAPVPPEVPAD